MRKPAAAVTSLAWFVLIGGTFGCLLPYLLNYWHFHQPLPAWGVARAVGVVLICAGLVPIVSSFAEFFRAGGTPVPVASPPRLVVPGRPGCAATRNRSWPAGSGPNTRRTGGPCTPGCPGCGPGHPANRRTRRTAAEQGPGGLSRCHAGPGHPARRRPASPRRR